MSQELATRDSNALAEGFTLTPEQVSLIKRTVAKGASDDELNLFIQVCKSANPPLNPFRREIHLIPVWDKESNSYVRQVHVGIDGLRRIAAATGQLDGYSGPFFKAKGGEWVDVWEDDENPPYACKLEVYRKGAARPFRGLVKFSSFARFGRDGEALGKWLTAPDHMLAKCTEAQALHKAFPEEMKGLGFEETIGGPSRVVNPDAELSYPQLGELHKLASRLRWNREERLARAFGVSSFTKLTKGQADELIDEWTVLLEESLTGEDGGGVGESVGADTSGNASSPVEGSGVEAFGEGATTPDATSRGEATGPPDDPSEPASAPEDAPSMGADVDGSEASPLDFTFAQGAFEGRLCSEVARNDYAQLKASFDKGNIALTRREAVRFFLARSEEEGSS